MFYKIKLFKKSCCTGTKSQIMNKEKIHTLFLTMTYSELKYKKCFIENMLLLLNMFKILYVNVLISLFQNGCINF